MLLCLVVEKCIMIVGGSKITWNLLRYSDLKLENVQNSKKGANLKLVFNDINFNTNYKKKVGIIPNVSKNVAFIMSLFDSLTKLTFYNENTMNRTCAIITRIHLLGQKYAVCIYQKVNIQERVMAPTTTTIYNPITAMEFSAMVTS